MFKVNKKGKKKTVKNSDKNKKNSVHDAIQQPLQFPHTKITDFIRVIFGE